MDPDDSPINAQPHRIVPVLMVPPVTDSSNADWLPDALRDAAAGDQQAWWSIVSTYSPRVIGLLRAQCGDAELAEELTQSTFCTVAAKIGDYAEVGRFEQWLFRIAMNRLRDEMRRRKRHARPVSEETLVGLAGEAEHEGSGAADPGDLAALRRAMDKLADADRQVIHLRHFAGLGFRQIADMLDQPLGTVLARQHRALRKIRELIEGEGGRDDSR